MMLLLCSIVVWGKASPFARLQADKTTLTVVADPPEGGSVSGGGSYEAGTSVQLRASASTGFQFVSWTRDGEVVSTANNFNYTKGDGDETLVAHFIYNPSNPSEPEQPVIKKRYVLNLVTEEGGYSLNGAGTYDEGTSVSVSVYTNTGFVFVGWYDSAGTKVSDQNRFDYVITGNETLTARFNYNPDSPSEPTQSDIKRNYVLTLLTEEGGYSLSGAGTYQEGTSARINVYVETGYLFTGWYDSNGELVSDQRSFDYTITGHATLTARFKYNPDSPGEPTQPDIKVSHRITVTASPEDGGTVNVENATVYEGEQTRVRAYTNSGFVFQGWYVADTLFQTAADFYYTMGKKDISMEARFVYNPESPSEPDVPDSRKYSIYLTSTRGLPGRTVQYPIYLSSLDSLTNIQFNLTFPAGLTPNLETIKLSGKAQGYTLSCKEVEVTPEESQGAPRRAADRESTYQFTLTDGKLPACNTRLMVIDVAISENITDTTQQVKVNQVTVTDTEGTNTTASTKNGTVVMNESSGDGTYYYLTLISTGSGQATVNSRTVRNSLHIFDLLEGSSTNVYFTPDNGYHIDKVTLDEVDITEQVRESSRYLFSNVNADATLTVMFAEGASSAYDLTLATDGNGKISYNGIDAGKDEKVLSVSHGAHVEMMITPNDGYHIKQVLLNDTIDVTLQVAEGKYVIESMTSANKVFASFELNPTVETPTIARSGNKVGISTATEDAVIYYTLDGSGPTAESMLYSDSITVERNCTIKAIAMRENYYPSQVATFEVDWFRVANVGFNQSGYVISLTTATEGASIRYTLSNSEAGEQTYAEPLTLTGDCDITAYATRDGYHNSDTTLFVFKAIDVTVAKPTIVANGNHVGISTTTEQATIYYTMDGSAPTENSTVYTDSIMVDHNCTVKAIAMRPNWFPSQVDSMNVDPFKVSNVRFDQNGYVISLTTATEGASIRYTLSNSEAGEQTYAEPLTLTGDCDITAYATRDGYHNSDTTLFVFKAIDVTVAKPTIVANGNHVGISTTTEQATIYYTMDGSAPTENSTVYTDSIMVDHNCTVKAIAMRPNWFSSEVDSLVVDWIVIGDASFDGLVATVSGERTLDEAFDSTGGRNEAAKTIAAIIWDKSTPVTENDLQGIDNPNLLIYVNESSLAPQSVKNVVVNGRAKKIVLTNSKEDNNNFYCPQAFIAEEITYSRTFQQHTQVGVSRGWETIALPFDVQNISHEGQGEIAPFGNNASSKHFWLRQLTQQGLAQATKIEANVPYIISMPNDTVTYYKDCILAGEVEFSAKDVMIPVTEKVTLALADNTIMMVPAFQSIQRSSDVWALNVGQERSEYFEGSVFERDYREVRPFEAYTIHRGDTPAPRFVSIKVMNGGTTGIENVERGTWNVERWYDLNGRRLQQKPTKKGVYLHNGHKVIVR